MVNAASGPRGRPVAPRVGLGLILLAGVAGAGAQEAATRPPPTAAPSAVQASVGTERAEPATVEVRAVDGAERETGNREAAAAKVSGDEPVATGAEAESVAPTAPAAAVPLSILGAEVPVGQSHRLSWSAGLSFSGIAVPTPVLVANGAEPGPTLCLTAALHGDELNGIEIVRRVMHGLSPGELKGVVIGVPIVNLNGFRRGSRYLPDRRDLNRYFPGDPAGNAAQRIAHSFFTTVISHCDALVDLHTGSLHRSNLPQVRADLDRPEVLELTRHFGATVVLHSESPEGSLREAANRAGIATVTFEGGGPMELDITQVEHGVKAVRTLLHGLGMLERTWRWGSREPVYYESQWIRSDHGGILLSRVKLGDTVRKGQVLATVTDPITNVRGQIMSPYSGRILGMASNQFVIPGYAAFRIGIQTDADSAEQSSESAPPERAAEVAPRPPPGPPEVHERPE